MSRPRPSFYGRHFADLRRERAFLSAVGFTTTFAGGPRDHARDPAGVGPVPATSAPAGRHIHHSTFGIFGLLGVGLRLDLPLGHRTRAGPRWRSRVTATAYGVASALTLDEFALWLDLQDDYWDKQGRKSIDAVAIFGGLLHAAARRASARSRSWGCCRS